MLYAFLSIIRRNKIYGAAFILTRDKNEYNTDSSLYMHTFVHFEVLDVGIVSLEGNEVYAHSLLHVT